MERQPRSRHGRYGARTPLTTAVSSDDGRTWRHRRGLEDDPNGHHCYTAMHFVTGDPERGLLAYCAGDSRRNGLATLQVTSVEVPWLYAKGGAP
ncbi:MAG: sialidase family protein [Spirochaetaceae bacterium]|nr:sialidase family protein [Spirochaetaceae bacterium]